MPQQPRSAVASILAFIAGSDPKYRERTPAAIIRFFVVVVICYAIGAALAFWPAWQSGYQSYFRGLGNAAFEQFLIWPQASVHFLDRDSPDLIKNIRAKAPPLTLPESFAVPHRDRMMDTLMLLKNVDPKRLGLGQFRTSSHIIGYWPLITVLTFSLATPWPWQRRIRLVFWSMLTAHAFLIFRLSVSLLQAGFADPKKSYRLFEMNTSWFDALKRFDSVINDNPVFSIIAPVLVWLVVVIGMEMWPAVRQKISGGFRLSRTNRDFGTADRQSFRDFERAGRHSSRGRKS